MRKYKHWHLEKDDANIVWLGMDRAGNAINSINDEVLDELNSLLQEIGHMTDAKGLIIHSTKAKGFVAGADVKVISQLDNPADAINFIRKGQAVLSRLESLSIPTVAMINGFCMGGGLELALACRYRVASDAQDTKLGLPEVLLGFHPGWGGTVRLPRLIGGFHALSQVILTGAALSASRAKHLGVVDDVVPVRQLRRAAMSFVLQKPAPHKPGFLQSLTNKMWVRPLLARIFRRQMAKKIRKEHYPAPFAIVDLWEREGGEGDRAYLKEADSVEQLITNSNTVQNLIRVFFLRERLKSFAKEGKFTAKHVHVIGAGVMGGDIAAWCALRGLRVSLQDTSHERIAPAIARANTLYAKKLKKPRLVQAAMDRLIPDPEGHGMAHADVIIEAVFENPEVKKTILKQMETTARKDAILATNTSSIPLDEINQVLSNPERLVGIHFFNPVSRMELVEVVSSKATSVEVAENACAFVHQIGRLPLPVKSSPGFLVNRVLMPYMLECMQLLDEGYRPESVDEAARAFGMMMGPVEMADTVGMDVCLAVAENLTAHFGGTVPNKLRQMVSEGKLGRKSGEGLYRYRDGRPVKGASNASAAELQEISQRLILRMVNEASACLREEVVADADLLDAGMIFATGFAPFLGGPMHYAKQYGEDKLNALFAQLAAQYGERFRTGNDLPH